MAGVLFIVTIPTAIEEQNIANKPKKLQFENALNENTKQKDSYDLTPIQQPDNFEYGTFKQCQTQSQEEFLPKNSLAYDSVSINICLSSTAEKSKKSLETDEAPTKLKRTKSAEFRKTKTISNIGTGETKTAKKPWEGIKEIVSSAKKLYPLDKKPIEEDEVLENRLLNIAIDSSMETVMIELLKKLKIESAIWQQTKNNNCYQITFSIESDYRHELILNILNEWGIGERDGSCVSMIPCAIYNRPNQDFESESEEEINFAQKQTAWDRFMNSIRARLNVAQIVQEVKQNAALTFDFVTLIVVAGTLAAFGLVEDSTILLVSSMLISPLMGPIIAITFGIVIKDKHLIRFGLVNEMIGILLATVIGFFFGLIVCSIDSRYIYGNDEGITSEMVSRCEFHSLLVGIFTALPSGAAVAIAILGENIGSLVGVAISASLLPPAVNSGILWSLSALYMLHTNDEFRFNTLIKTNHYSDNQAVELAVYGAISMLLTIVNIICILLMGVVVLKIKEVAPIASKNQRQFWKLARNYNKNCHPDEDLFTQKLADEITEFQACETDRIDLGVGAEILRNISRSSYQNTWSPMSSRHTIQRSKDHRPSIADLEKICMHMAIPSTQADRWIRPPSYGVNSSIIGKIWSPPKYRSLQDSVNGPNRRASMPYASSLGLSSHGHNLSVFGGFKGGQLEKISEVTKSDGSDQNIEKTDNCGENDRLQQLPNPKPKRTSRKFIVTPAADP